MTLSQKQLAAACDEAKAQGLRPLVHAYRDAVRIATLAGCTQIEHGLGASDDDLRLMAERGTYLDPQAGLVFVMKGGIVHKHDRAARQRERAMRTITWGPASAGSGPPEGGPLV